MLQQNVADIQRCLGVLSDESLFESCRCSIRHNLISPSPRQLSKGESVQTGSSVGRLERAGRNVKTSLLMGAERSTVAVSPFVKERSGGVVWSRSCWESSFTRKPVPAGGGKLGAQWKMQTAGRQSLMKREKRAVVGCQARMNYFWTAPPTCSI